MYEVFDYLISTVDYLVDNQKAEVSKDKICFNPNNFKNVLGHFSSPAKVKKHMKIYKSLGFIVSDIDKSRFTQTQRVKGKLRKVVVVNKSAIDTLKKIKEGVI